MLIVSGTSRADNRRELARQASAPVVPVRLVVRRSQLELQSLLWRDYWAPSKPFFEVDLRLVQRLNRLKKAWRQLLQQPTDRYLQMIYCWRYFGLLHHACAIAAAEPERPDPFAAIARIVGFESFLLEASGESGAAAALFTARHPLAILGQLASEPRVPTPRYVPLLRPADADDIYYHYRQLQISGMPAHRLFVAPAVELSTRASSLLPIDRLNRLLSHRPDPYWRPRAQVLSERVLSPVIRWIEKTTGSGHPDPIDLLDLGAGTGHLLATAWTTARKSTGIDRSASLHFVDSNPPAFGRSFGLARDQAGVTHVEWTTADYRTLADDDQWLTEHGPFGVVFLCRVLDNTSNFSIENIEADAIGIDLDESCLPHWCLAPREQPEGVGHLQVGTTRRSVGNGIAYPQFSLRDYFAALRVVQDRDIDAFNRHSWYLPVRRFNPAALITPSGRSLIRQLAKHAQAVVIEDVDLQPEHLVRHRDEFGLAGVAAVACGDDGFRTEATHIVVGQPDLLKAVRGERLW